MRSLGRVGEEVAHRGKYAPRAWRTQRLAARCAARGHAAPAGADPPRHRQPAGERDRRPPSCCATTSPGTASRASSTRRTPERANLVARLPGRGDGPSLLLLSHTDTVVADAGRVGGRPLVGRGARQRDLGPRRARHEGPGRRGGGRDRLARARRLRAGGRPGLRGLRRRGGRRRLRAGVALRAPSRRGPHRLRAQRGRGRADRALRPALLPLLERREDELAVPAAACTAAPGTPRCRGSPTTRSSRRRR